MLSENRGYEETMDNQEYDPNEMMNNMMGMSGEQEPKKIDLVQILLHPVHTDQ